MIVSPLLPAYTLLLTQYLQAADDLAREAALLEAGDLARTLLLQQATVDEMLSLHQQAKARLAAECRQAEKWPTLMDRLADGGDMPMMLALLLPQQLAERQRQEQRWLAEHDKLSAMFEQTDDLVLVFDAQGRLDYANPAFERATGLRESHAREDAQQRWPTLLTGGGTRQLQTEQARTDGSQFTAAWSVAAITHTDGRLLNHVCIGRDITQAQRIEEGVRQNDKLRAVATLAAGVAHDFNNLLGTIIGLAELSEMQATPGSAQARNLGNILVASHRASGLVAQLLSYAAERPLALQRLSLGALLQGCAPLLAASLPRTAHLHWQVLVDALVQADPAQLEQVLLNLVKNAGHALAAQSGESVQVLLDTESPTPAAVEQPAGWARLRVIDHGPGIPPEVMPRIFEPFFTTKPVDQGTGLGLAAAHGIVRHHGGRLEASSPAGGPTVFTVWLPLASSR